MDQHLALVTILVREYDEAIEFYTKKLGFELQQDSELEDGKRWARPVGVAIGPDGEIYFTSDAGFNGLYRLKKL